MQTVRSEWMRGSCIACEGAGEKSASLTLQVKAYTTEQVSYSRRTFPVLQVQTLCRRHCCPIDDLLEDNKELHKHLSPERTIRHL